MLIRIFLPTPRLFVILYLLMESLQYRSFCRSHCSAYPVNIALHNRMLALHRYLLLLFVYSWLIHIFKYFFVINAIREIIETYAVYMFLYI